MAVALVGIEIHSGKLLLEQFHKIALKKHRRDRVQTRADGIIGVYLAHCLPATERQPVVAPAVID